MADSKNTSGFVDTDRTTDFTVETIEPDVTNASSSVDADRSIGTNAGLSGLKNQAMEQGSTLLNQTKEVAGQAFDSAKSQVKTQLTSQKDRAADSLSSAVRALEATGQQFRDNDLGFVAGYADNLTTQVRQVTDYLHDKDIDDLTRDVESFARRNPAIFIGGAFLLGIAVARFLKSSDATNYDPRGGNALVPLTNRDNLPATLSDTAAFVSTEPGREINDVYGNRPLTAHNYVPGIGNTGSGADL